MRATLPLMQVTAFPSIRRARLNTLQVADLAEFLAQHEVEVVASLPGYCENNINRERGKGMFEASLRGCVRLASSANPLALHYGLGWNKILSTIHVYPPHSEANKYAAGAWRRNPAPPKLLAYVERYHAWMRA